MQKHSIKPVLIGVAVGLALVVVPFFLLKAMIFMLIIGGLFRLFGVRKFRWGVHRGLHPSFADTIRHMNEEEYKVFRQSLSGDYHHRRVIPISESK